MGNALNAPTPAVRATEAWRRGLLPCASNASCVFGTCNATTGLCDDGCAGFPGMMPDQLWARFPACTLPEWGPPLAFTLVSLLSIVAAFANWTVLQMTERNMVLKRRLLLGTMVGNLLTVVYMAAVWAEGYRHGPAGYVLGCLVQIAIVFFSAFVLLYMFQVPAVRASKQGHLAVELRNRLIATSGGFALILVAAELSVTVFAAQGDPVQITRGQVAHMASLAALGLYEFFHIRAFTQRLLRQLQALRDSAPSGSPLANMLGVNITRIRIFSIIVPVMCLCVFVFTLTPLVTILVLGFFPFFWVVWFVLCLVFPLFGLTVYLLLTKGARLFQDESSSKSSSKQRFVGGAELGLNSYEEHLDAKRKQDRVGKSAIVTFQPGSVGTFAPESVEGSMVESTAAVGTLTADVATSSAVGSADTAGVESGLPASSSD